MIKLNDKLIKEVKKIEIDSLYGEDYIDIDANTSLVLSRSECIDSPKYIMVHGTLIYSDNINGKKFVKELISCNEEIKLGVSANYYDTAGESREGINNIIKEGYQTIISDMMEYLLNVIEMGQPRIKKIVENAT